MAIVPSFWVVIFYGARSQLGHLTQRAYLNSNGLTLNVDARYSEPLGKIGLLFLGYNYSPQWNQADQNTFAITAEGDSHFAPQSSVFENQYYAHRGGVGLYFERGGSCFYLTHRLPTCFTGWSADFSDGI